MSKEDPFHTGEKLRQLRLRNNDTQEKVAEALGVAPNTLSEYEHGKRLPSREVLQKAAAFFKVDVGIFFNTEHLTFNLHGNQQANGYVNEQHNTSKELLDRFIAHIDARDKRIEDLFAMALDVLKRRPKK